MANEDDDFELVKLGLITLDKGKNRYDVFDLYEKEDCDSNDFVFGRYYKQKWHLIVGAASSEGQLSQNLSQIAIFSEKGLHRTFAVSERVFNSNFYLN